MLLRTIFLSCLLAFSLPAMAAEEAVIGTLIEVEGSTTLTPEQGAASSAKIGSALRAGDTLETSEKARLLVLLLDDTQIILSGDAELTFNEYIYDPTNEIVSKATYEIPRGSFLYTGGFMTKTKEHEKPSEVRIQTAYSDMSVKHGQVWGGNMDGAYGVLAHQGEVQVSTNEGRVLLNEGMGVMLKDKKDAPGAIKRWSESKIKKAAHSVKLRNADKIQSMISAYKAQQALLAPKAEPKAE